MGCHWGRVHRIGAIQAQIHLPGLVLEYPPIPASFTMGNPITKIRSKKEWSAKG